MRHDVLLTAGAERDLAAIHDHLLEVEGEAAAEHVLKRLLKVVEDLAELPERGTFPKELIALGIREYRQVYFKPYRLVYRLIGPRVYVVLITDGRRDMQRVLARRLLESG
jgi:toxin ParE1/3/4